MVCLSAPDPIRIRLNLEANVGRGQPNRPDDVQMVQFGYWCLAHDPLALITPQGRAIYGAVKPGAPFRDVPSDPLSQAIVAHQQYKGGTQDGYISVLPKGQTIYGKEKTYRMFAYLLASIYEVTKDIYPRLDLHPNCPGVLKERMKYITSL